VEREFRSDTVIGLIVPGPFVVGDTLTVSDAATHHLRVRRTAVGDDMALYDGAGQVAEGRLTSLTTHRAQVAIASVRHVPRPPAVHLLAPVADRDRMLWLAEKATELGLTSWQAVRWRRSRSVSPRGEGPAFATKVHARMGAAVEQSGNPWLPAILPDAEPATAAAECNGEGSRYLLTAAAPVMLPPMSAPVTIALGPEGGFEDDEAALFQRSGFIPASVGAHTLRFETAGMAALALVRAMLEIPG
jgi:16S rRNA (uracil1498-N3)-methyltransferase